MCHRKLGKGPSSRRRLYLQVGKQNRRVEKGSGAEARRDSNARGPRDRKLGRRHELVLSASGGGGMRWIGEVGVSGVHEEREGG